MHVRTDHINRHASVSGPYGDSTGAISNGAAQFSVLSPNLRAFGGGLYAGCSKKKHLAAAHSGGITTHRNSTGSYGGLV